MARRKRAPQGGRAYAARRRTDANCVFVWMARIVPLFLAQKVASWVPQGSPSIP